MREIASPLSGPFTTFGQTPIDIYKVGAYRPELAYSFYNDYYRRGRQPVNLLEAITHTRNGNATMTDSSGNLVWAPHNLVLNSATPATQSITVVSGVDYTVGCTGVSITLSGAGTGTATEGSPVEITASTTTLTLTVIGSSGAMWAYRSDLGGMADVPASERALPTATKYVSTTDAARYLPRVNHHAYNGSQWVNKGLLVESEARTNLVTYSEDLSNAAWIKTTNLTLGTPLSIGGISLDLLQNNGVANFRDVTQNGPSVPAGGYVTFSVYVKAGTSSETAIRIQDPTNTDRWTVPITWSSGVPSFQNGTGTLGWTEVQKTIENIGAGVYRVALTIKNDTAGAYTATCKYYVQWDDAAATVDTYAGGFQAELGSTPSSYIPTNGASVTRPAESITIPAANLPWPSPVYVTGEELVTNGDFATNGLTGWTDNSVGVGAVSAATGAAVHTGGTVTDAARLYQSIPTEVGATYRIEFTTSSITAANALIRMGTSNTGSQALLHDADSEGAGTYVSTFVASASLYYFNTYALNGSMTVDNISVKEINPLALSIQMKGEMTYADTDQTTEVSFFDWSADASNYIVARMRTNAGTAGTGIYNFLQTQGGTVESIFGPELAGDINVPFNIASRHGSTFINGAVDGVALTANTTPVALPDLENTDLELAYDFNGTIDTFRIWASDIGDTGIEEAST